MKIRYKQSIKEKIDDAIDRKLPSDLEIDFIELNQYEYIQFLEELEDIQKLLIIDPITKLRVYKNIRIKVLS